VEDISTISTDYRNYESYKKWQDKLFDNSGADYFEAEFRGLPVAESRVIEIGFGAGQCMAWLASRGAQVTGLEIQPRLVVEGRSRGFDTHLSREFDWTPLTGKVDLIVGFDVLEHLTDAETVSLLRTGAVALKPGGAMLFRFPNMASHMIPGLTLEAWRDAALPPRQGHEGNNSTWCQRLLTSLNALRRAQWLYAG
jgi:2-polyprenyl-3-methyl-5-hydroxy-6-metoxy-1,4-benzoquinol methylase